MQAELTGTITSLARMSSACAQLDACNFLDMVFSGIWKMGEHMNRGTTKANAAAFGAATLGLLKGMKVPTLPHYVLSFLGVLLLSTERHKIIFCWGTSCCIGAKQHSVRNASHSTATILSLHCMVWV